MRTALFNFAVEASQDLSISVFLESFVLSNYLRIFGVLRNLSPIIRHLFFTGSYFTSLVLILNVIVRRLPEIKTGPTFASFTTCSYKVLFNNFSSCMRTQLFSSFHWQVGLPQLLPLSCYLFPILIHLMCGRYQESALAVCGRGQILFYEKCYSFH